MIRLFFLFLIMSVVTVKANTLTIVMNTSGEDTHSMTARILSKYFIKHNNNIKKIEYKIIPGAGSIIAANYLYNIASKDGSTIGVFMKNIPLIGIIGGQNIDYDPSNFVWLGSVDDGRKDAVILLSHKKYDGEIIIGSNNIDIASPSSFIQRVLNWNIKDIQGYKSVNDVRLSFERKEIDALIANLNGLRATRPNWILDNKYHILLQFGNFSTRNSSLPNVPTIAELSTSNNKEEILAFEQMSFLLRPYVAPPNIPKTAQNELRKMFHLAVNDNDFIEEALSKNIAVNYISWSEAEKIIDDMKKTPKHILNNFK